MNKLIHCQDCNGLHELRCDEDEEMRADGIDEDAIEEWRRVCPLCRTSYGLSDEEAGIVVH